MYAVGRPLSVLLSVGILIAPSPLPNALAAPPTDSAAVEALSGLPAPHFSPDYAAGDAAGDAPGDAAAAALAATADVVRAATAEETAAFHALALASQELAAARERLSPLTVDTARPRAVGTTVGQIGIYYPLLGALDGPASQYGLWFDAETGRVTAEAEFVRLADGVRARVVVEGSMVVDGRLEDPGATDGDFWDCLKECLGAVMDDDLVYILRSLCLRYCGPWPAPWCHACLLAVGILEAGMVSGCTHTCLKHP